MTTAAVSAASPTGASQRTQSGSGEAATGDGRRNAQRNAHSAPTRISAARAGVAQYAASAPHTHAINGAAAAKHAVTTLTVTN